MSGVCERLPPEYLEKGHKKSILFEKRRLHIYMYKIANSSSLFDNTSNNIVSDPISHDPKLTLTVQS